MACASTTPVAAVLLAPRLGLAAAAAGRLRAGAVCAGRRLDQAAILRRRPDPHFLRQPRHAAGHRHRRHPGAHAGAGTRRQPAPATGELRAAASYAGLKFTDTEPFYGDAYGQVAVSLLPREHAFGKPEGRTSDQIVAAMRGEIEQLQLGGRISFTVLSGGPPAEKPIKVRLRGDDYAQLRAATDALKAVVAEIPGSRDMVDDDLPGRRELCCASMPTRCAPPASTRRWSRAWCGCTRKAKSSPWRATRARRSRCACAARNAISTTSAPRSTMRWPAGRRHHDAGQSGQRRSAHRQGRHQALRLAPRHHHRGRSGQNPHRYPGRQRAGESRMGCAGAALPRRRGRLLGRTRRHPGKPGCHARPVPARSRPDLSDPGGAVPQLLATVD
jgi:hypothetical protein